MKPKAGSKAARATKAAAADGTSELDFTGYAKTLGMSVRNGIVHKEGGTLNKILMDALAKEYLRCVAALRYYQTTFGPLQDDPLEHQGDFLARGGVAASPIAAIDPDASRTQSSSTSLNPSLDLATITDSAAAAAANLANSGAPTTLSPTAPLSPDPKCRVGSNDIGVTLSVPTGLQQPLQISTASTPSTAGPVHTAGSPVANVTTHEEEGSPQPNPNVTQPVPSVQESKRISFGLFGR